MTCYGNPANSISAGQRLPGFQYDLGWFIFPNSDHLCDYQKNEPVHDSACCDINSLRSGLMKTFTLISLFFQLTVVSASAFATPQSQQIFRDNASITVVNFRHLLAAHNDDPIEVIRLLDPHYAKILHAPRLVEVFGTEPVWMTEGDKLRLKKQGLSFTDLTGHENITSTLSSNKDNGACVLPWGFVYSSMNNPPHCRMARPSTSGKRHQGHQKLEGGRDSTQSR